MATVFDVAEYILSELGPISHMKLQKLVYYSQAWSLVWDDRPLFDEPIEAWVNGPVVPDLYQRLKGWFTILPKHSLKTASPVSLLADQKATVDAVIKFYGHRDSQWLSDLTHMEAPWIEARAGIPPGVRSNRPITHASMAEYYSGL